MRCKHCGRFVSVVSSTKTGTAVECKEHGHYVVGVDSEWVIIKNTWR